MKRIFTLFVILLCISTSNFGQIARWNFYGQSSPVTSTVTASDPNVSVSFLSRGTGAGASTASNSFRTIGFKDDGISTSNTDYFQFSVTVNSGYTLSLSSLNSGFGGTASYYNMPGVTSQYAYSLDGTNYFLIGSPLLTTSITITTNLSGIAALQNISGGATVYFRYYASGQTSTGGWGYASSSLTDDGLVLNGTATFCGTWTGNTSKDWNTGSNWCSGLVPTVTTLVTIPAGLTNYPIISSADANAASVSIAANASLTMNGTGNLTIAGGGTFNNNGTFTATASTGAVIFSGSGSVSGTTVFNNVTVNGAVDFGTASTVNGNLMINSGGSLSKHTVTYNSSSVLTYNTTSSIYPAGLEWTGNATTAGSGIPQNIMIQNSNTVSLPASDRGLAGNLLISPGSGLSLSTVANKDLYIAGNWTNNGIFSHNNRKVTFNATSGTQLISGSGNNTFYNLTQDNVNTVANYGTGIITIDSSFRVNTGTMNGGTSTFIFKGATGLIGGQGSKNFYNIQINSGANIADLVASSGNIHVDNSFSNNGTFNQFNTHTFYFDKSNAVETMSGTGYFAFGNLTIGGASLSFPTTLNTGSCNFTITGNSLSFNSKNSSLSSTAGMATFASGVAGTCMVKSAMSVTGASANFYDVQIDSLSGNIATSVDFGNGLSNISHSLTLNKLSAVTGNAPIYGNASTLVYNTAIAGYPTGQEWINGTTTPGVGGPANVVIKNTDKIVMNGNRGLGGNLIFNAPGNSLSLNNYTLTLNGSYVGSGYLSGSNTSGLVINSNAGTAYFTPGGVTNVLQTLTVTGSGRLSLGDSLYITAGSTFGTVIADGILTTNNYLVLRSDINGTAQVGVSTGSINGNVTVERFIASGTGSPKHRKSWQLLAIPTQGQTIKNAWQEGAAAANANPHPGYGTMITSNITGATSYGFDDYTLPGPSMKVYNQSTNQYDGPANTTATAIYNQKGYFVFVRGDRSVTVYNQKADSTILRTAGTLFTANNQPPVTTIPANSFECIGNPYASAIDIRNIAKSSGISNFVYVWDPKIGGAYNYGAFAILSYDGTNYRVVTNYGGSYGAYNTINNYIQSGQAFFMQTAPSSSGTVAFPESCKGGGSFTGLIFTRHAQNNAVRVQPAADPRIIRTTLLESPKGDSIGEAIDGTLSQFSDQYNNAVDEYDARKMNNTGENLSIKSAGRLLSVEQRNLRNETDTVFLNITNEKQQDYQLSFDITNLPADRFAFLQDLYTKQLTPLAVSGNTLIKFSVTNTPASYDPARFRILITTAKILPVTFSSFSALKERDYVKITWTAACCFAVDHFEVQRSQDGIHFHMLDTVKLITGSTTSAHRLYDTKPAEGDNYYRIKSVGIHGESYASNITKVVFETVTGGIKVYPNPVQHNTIFLYALKLGGKYTAELYNNSGQLVAKQVLTHTSGFEEKLTFKKIIAAGVYDLIILSPAIKPQTIQVLF